MEQIARALEAHRTFFKTGKTLNVAFRREGLQRLKSGFMKPSGRICINRDSRRSDRKSE